MKYIIALNKKMNESDQHDYFTDSEYNEIKVLAEETGFDYTIVQSEMEFIKYIEDSEYLEELVVLNLTRSGSLGNKKTLVNSYCDLRNIFCISSSAFTVNVCRHKRYSAILVNNYLELFPVTLGYQDVEKINLNNKKYILKSIQGAGSLDLTEDKVGEVRLKNGYYFLNEYKLSKELLDEFTLQEFADGIEIEVPFIIINGMIEILGIYQVILPEGAIILNESDSDNFNYHFKMIDNLDEDYILDAILKIVDVLDINYYGRVDFKIKDVNDVTTYKVFDIATTPYFIENTSFNQAFINNEKFKSKHTNVLALLLSLKK